MYVVFAVVNTRGMETTQDLMKKGNVATNVMKRMLYLIG